MTVPDEPGAGAWEAGDGEHGHGRRTSQRAALERLAAEPADILVIGGGITGAGVARDTDGRRYWCLILADPAPAGQAGELPDVGSITIFRHR